MVEVSPSSAYHYEGNAGFHQASRQQGLLAEAVAAIGVPDLNRLQVQAKSSLSLPGKNHVERLLGVLIGQREGLVSIKLTAQLIELSAEVVVILKPRHIN